MNNFNFKGIDIPQIVAIPGKPVFQIVVDEAPNAKNEQGNITYKRRGKVALIEGSKIMGASATDASFTTLKIETDRNQVLNVTVAPKNEQELMDSLIFTDGVAAKAMQNHLNAEYSLENELRLEELQKEMAELSAGMDFLKEITAANALTPSK